MTFEFSLKNFLYILFIMGFINLIRDFVYAIKIKNTVKKATFHFFQLKEKIEKNDKSIGEHLIFLTQNHQILNKSGLGGLYFRYDSYQPMLSNILANFPEYLKFYRRDDLLHSLYSLGSRSFEIDSNFNLLKYFFNFFNPFMYLKRSIPIILNSFYEIFPLRFPNFIKIILESISLIFGVLLSLKQISPNIYTKLISFFENLI